MDSSTHNPAVLHLVIALFALFLISLIPVFYQIFRFNKVTCATCGDRLRERDSVEHGGDPEAYTHPGICADRQSKIHADAYYADNR